MRQFFRRLFCLHSNWSMSLDQRGRSAPWQRVWQCDSCGKRREWYALDCPINYVEN